MLQKIISMLLLATVGFIFCSCNSVSYNGSHLPATKTVKVYYAKSLIKRPYQVMGKASATTWFSGQKEALRLDLVEKAKTCGADAILIDSIKEKISAPIRVEEDSEIDDGKMAANHPGGRSEDILDMLPEEGGEQTIEEVDTSRIDAEFLKFTD